LAKSLVTISKSLFLIALNSPPLLCVIENINYIFQWVYPGIKNQWMLIISTILTVFAYFNHICFLLVFPLIINGAIVGYIKKIVASSNTQVNWPMSQFLPYEHWID